MARWDEILTLPIQNPPTLEFSSADLVWSRVEGWRETIDRVALIPFTRVDDFVRGESSNKECPTKFHVEARRRRPPEMLYKPKVDGILEYVLYWCSFGPDDHRKGGVIRPSRVYNIKKTKTAGRPNTKRGCVCHFIVKRLIAEPSVALIIYNQEKHVDKKGLPCHGPQDKKAVGTRAMYAPYISDELRLRVLSLLYVGVPVETIMQRHTESVEKQGGPCNRDDLLTHRYVRRLERSLRRSIYETDADDMISLGNWIESHRSHVFFYEDFSDLDPFVLGIQTEWQLQQMIRFGNNSIVASDSRFGTNKLKYPVHSLLVFDSNNRAIPVAWIVTPRFASADMYRWIRALYDRVHSKDPSWKLAGFMVDDPSADIDTIREVFHCSVLISFWRVRHAWHKNLIKKCSETEMRMQISRQLGQAIYRICRVNGDIDLFEDFMEDFVDCSYFLDYFKAIWFPRMGMWTTALKTLPLVSQETCAAMECYHHQLKLRLLNEKDPSVYQRVDWLVDKLDTKVHSYYWLDGYSGKDDFARYHKNEWKSGLTSWSQASQIPESDVVLEQRCVKIYKRDNQQKVHVVWNPGSEFAICECRWSRMGYLCKHVIKASRVCRDRGLAVPSISLFEYNRGLINILHCPPRDSLTRDHAVSLAVQVQMQLNTIVEPGKSQTSPSMSASIGQQMVDGVASANHISDNRNKHMVNESQYVTENVSSNGNAFGVRDECQGNTTADSKKVIDISDNGNKQMVNESQYVTENVSSNGNAFGVRDECQGNTTADSDKVIDLVRSEDGVCYDVVEESVSRNTMDVDLQSIQSSLPTKQQEEVHEVASAEGISNKGGDLSSKSQGMERTVTENVSSNSNAFGVKDDCRGNITVDSNEAIDLVRSEDGDCHDVVDESASGNTTNVYLQSIQSLPPIKEQQQEHGIASTEGHSNEGGDLSNKSPRA